MSRISRRDFLAGLTAAAGAAAFSGQFSRAAEGGAKIKSGTDLVTLGRSDVQPTLLGVGTGTVGGSQQVGMGQAEFTKMIRHALDRGIRYIDTADMYSTHLFVRLALQGVPREKYFIQTKTQAKNAEVAKADIDRLCRELRVKYIDSLLMHCMTKGTWPTDMRPVMDVLQEAKQKGRVRAVGISSHNMPPLEASVDQGDFIDVQLVRINPFGVKAMMDGEPEQVAPLVQKMHKQGRGIIGMKIYGETGFRVKGKDTPESRQKRLDSLKYVLGLGCVDCFTIGFVDPKQIDETLELIEQAQA